MFLGIFAAFISSCSSLDTKSQTGIKGDWRISDVSYSGSDFIKVNSFDIADSKCLEGSSWKFVSSNNKGEMSLNKTGCPLFSSPIIWSVTKDGLFTLKITEGEKAKRVTQGYNLRMRNQTDSSFQLIDNVNVGGRNVEVVYQFQKM